MGGYQERAFESDTEATTAIRRAMRDADGSEVLAAQILGISYRTLSRYVTRLGLRDELKAMQRNSAQAGKPGKAQPLAGTDPTPSKNLAGLAKAFRG